MSADTDRITKIEFGWAPDVCNTWTMYKMISYDDGTKIRENIITCMDEKEYFKRKLKGTDR